MAKQPKWISPARQAHLAKLFADSQGFCVYGHKPCKGHWTEQKSVVCAWGKICNSPNPDKLCRFKPEDGKPHLPCEVLHLTFTRWRCDYGDYPCYTQKEFVNELGDTVLKGECYFKPYAARLIKDWTVDDKAQTLATIKAESIASHKTNNRTYPYHSESGFTHFNRSGQPHSKPDSAVIRDLFYDNQPCFMIEGLTVNALTFKPCAKVRLASTNQVCFVDLTEALKPLSKNARRKALRYGEIPNDVNVVISHAVRRALSI